MKWGYPIALTAISFSIPAAAQSAGSTQSMQSQLDAAITMIGKQQDQLDRQAEEILELRRMIESEPVPTASLQADGTVDAPTNPEGQASVAPPTIPFQPVGEAPEDYDRPVELAVLDNQGSVVTRRGQLTGEFHLEYARADRNRAVFRGVELIEAILIGVFDINESRQNVVSSSLSLRYGLTDRLEIGARLPFVYRSDTSIVAPISGSTNNDAAATIDNSVKGSGIGDLELTARYQVLSGGLGNPFVIANLQGVFPTGSDPFAIPRDELGRSLRASTGAGFYGITPSVTAILPSDPVVLFGTLGYTFNLSKSVDTRIPPVNITFVDPGDAISVSAGIGISFNQRTTLNLGYAHSWAFGTRTTTSLLEPIPGEPIQRETTSRDLQVGRLLFGVTYRATRRASINWSVEIGATEDATDLRTSLRIPLVLLDGR